MRFRSACECTAHCKGRILIPITRSYLDLGALVKKLPFVACYFIPSFVLPFLGVLSFAVFSDFFSLLLFSVSSRAMLLGPVLRMFCVVLFSVRFFFITSAYQLQVS